MAAVTTPDRVASSSPSSRAASAVELVATVSAQGIRSVRKRRHWAVATGMDATRFTSVSTVPGAAIRWRWMSSTTSRWMKRSKSKTRLSMVSRTVPSMAFSMGTNPRSTRPCWTPSRTSTRDGKATSSARA